MLRIWAGCLVCMFVGIAVTARPGAESWEERHKVCDSREKQAIIYVYSPESAEPTVVSPGSRLWFNGATAHRIEWNYGESDAIAPVWAISGSVKWPFSIDSTARQGTFVVPDDAREMWGDQAKLEIMCEGHKSIQLCLRPREVSIGPQGAEFSVKEHSSSFVPGSNEWVEVVLNRVIFAWVNLSIRTVEGEMLTPPRDLYQGKYESIFWVGDNEYSIRVEKVMSSTNIFGRETVKLRVIPRWSLGKAGRLEFEDGENVSQPPNWCKTIEVIERGLATAEEHTSRAYALVDESWRLDAHAFIESARLSLKEARHRLRWLKWLPRLWIGPEGTVFTVENHSGCVVPGSRGWVEVVVGRISPKGARFCIRTVAGITLVSPRTIALHDEVEFRIGAEVYAIRVERFWEWCFFNRYGKAKLRLMRREDTTGPQDVRAEDLLWISERSKEDLLINGQGPTATRQPPSLNGKILELIEQGIARSEENLIRSRSLLAHGNSGEAHTALEMALQSQVEVHQGLYWIYRLTGEELMKKHNSINEDLSLIKVRVVNAVPALDLSVLFNTAFERKTSKLIQGRVKDAVEDMIGDVGVEHFQRIRAEILETHTVGSRYAFGTKMGRRYPLEKRSDVEPGQIIDVSLWEYKDTFPGIIVLERGKEYWLAITPPLALKSIPRMQGESGRFWITFVMPSNGL